jgi:hypothetical protein
VQGAAAATRGGGAAVATGSVGRVPHPAAEPTLPTPNPAPVCAIGADTSVAAMIDSGGDRADSADSADSGGGLSGGGSGRGHCAATDVIERGRRQD